MVNGPFKRRLPYTCLKVRISSCSRLGSTAIRIQKGVAKNLVLLSLQVSHFSNEQRSTSSKLQPQYQFAWCTFYPNGSKWYTTGYRRKTNISPYELQYQSRILKGCAPPHQPGVFVGNLPMSCPQIPLIILQTEIFSYSSLDYTYPTALNTPIFLPLEKT